MTSSRQVRRMVTPGRPDVRKARIRATEPRMKTDRGTCDAVGLTDATSASPTRRGTVRPFARVRGLPRPKAPIAAKGSVACLTCLRKHLNG